MRRKKHGPQSLEALALPANTLTRAARAAQDQARLAATPPDPLAMAEAAELGAAAFERMVALQQKWLDAWIDWGDYAQSITGANTVPKLSERAGNIVLQAQAQMQSQVNDMTELAENIGVSYSFWLSQLRERRGL